LLFYQTKRQISATAFERHSWASALRFLDGQILRQIAKAYLARMFSGKRNVLHHLKNEPRRKCDNVSRLSDNISMYWPLVVGTLLFVPAAWRYYTLGQWEAHIYSAAAALFGYVAVIAPDELSSWTGRYGWTYESFWTYPATYVRFFGFTLLVGALVFGF